MSEEKPELDRIATAMEDIVDDQLDRIAESVKGIEYLLEQLLAKVLEEQHGD